MALEVTIPAYLAKEALGVYNRQALGASTPVDMDTASASGPLIDAAVRRSAQIAPNAPEHLVSVNAVEPTPGKYSSKYASQQRAVRPADKRPVSIVNINPNVDRSYFAHELGHGVSQQTKIGNFINNARHFGNANPALARALRIALPGALAGTGAALQAGDDDLAASLAIAAAAASPTLIDEALASKNALAIMQDAGMRATPGQRTRLAGGYLSYLAPVIIAGSVGNALGNVVDEKTALYDL